MMNKSDLQLIERYQIEGEMIIIEIAIDEPSAIYNDKDPSPLRLRDFKKNVEKYITNEVI